MLSLLDVDREVLADLLAIGLGELGVAQTHAAATALNGAELLDDDDIEAVVDAGAGGSAASVASTDDDDVGGLGGSAASRVNGLGSGHEGRHGLLIGRARSVDAASLGGGSILHVLIGARATSKRSSSRTSSQSGYASTSKERTTREGHISNPFILLARRGPAAALRSGSCTPVHLTLVRLAAGWPSAHHITRARRGPSAALHGGSCTSSTPRPHAPCSWPPGVSPRFLKQQPTVFAGVEDPGCYQPEQRQPEGFPKLRIRSRAFLRRGPAAWEIPQASEQNKTFQLLTAVPGPYRAGRTACRTRRQGSGRASRSCRCWRRSRRS